MALDKTNNFAVGDANLDELMTHTNVTDRGHHKVSLTEMTTTTVPKIAAGSVIEVAGATYEAGTDITLGGSPSDGTVYIYIVPNGATATAVMTNTAPTWSDAKQGWYGTGGAATYRYVHYVMTKATAAYSNKIDSALPFTAPTRAGFLSTGARFFMKELSVVFASGDTTKSVAHGLTAPFTNNTIIDILWRADNYNGATLGKTFSYYGGYVSGFTWNDTNVSVILGAAPGGTGATYYLTVVYK